MSCETAQYCFKDKIQRTMEQKRELKKKKKRAEKLFLDKDATAIQQEKAQSFQQMVLEQLESHVKKKKFLTSYNNKT